MRRFVPRPRLCHSEERTNGRGAGIKRVIPSGGKRSMEINRPPRPYSNPILTSGVPSSSE